MDINEMVIAVEVDSEVIDKVLKGEITHLLMDINEDNQTLLLENVDGNLVLTTDELPETFHGCYFYNNGKFPYAIKDAVTFLELNSSEDYHCLLRIIDIDVEAGMRFNYQGAGKPIMEDPDGDSCVWKLGMEVVPVPAEPKVSATFFVELEPMLVMTITEATPIITPSSERKVRVLLRTKLFSAFIKSSHIITPLPDRPVI